MHCLQDAQKEATELKAALSEAQHAKGEACRLRESLSQDLQVTCAVPSVYRYAAVEWGTHGCQQFYKEALAAPALFLLNVCINEFYRHF